MTTELLFAAVIPEMLVPCTDDTDTVSEYLAIAETAVTTVLLAVCRSDLSGHQASCAVMCRSGRRVFFSEPTLCTDSYSVYIPPLWYCSGT